MISIKKIKTKNGIIYEATAKQRGLSARASKKKTALKILMIKINMSDFIEGFKDFFKNSLRIK